MCPAVTSNGVDAGTTRTTAAGSCLLRRGRLTIGEDRVGGSEVCQVGGEGGNARGEGDVGCHEVGERGFLLGGGVGQVIQVAVKLRVGGRS